MNKKFDNIVKNVDTTDTVDEVVEDASKVEVVKADGVEVKFYAAVEYSMNGINYRSVPYRTAILTKDLADKFVKQGLARKVDKV